MSRHLLLAAISIAALGVPLWAAAKEITELKSLDLTVPVSDKMFPAGPGADAINENCLTCHSQDHVMNQPTLTREGWKEVVEKMVVSYKAPIEEEDQKTIVDYLVRIKGKP